MREVYSYITFFGEIVDIFFADRILCRDDKSRVQHA
jgi:hypothetical protein